MQKSLILARAVVGTPIGKIIIETDDSNILRLEIAPSASEAAEFQKTEPSRALAGLAVTQVSEYFAGTRKDFDLPTRLQGTSFQKSVWDQISTIEFGEQLTYGEIATRIGNPAASRAVGAAVGANPVPIIIPCHRVMGSSRKITGYSGGEGIPTKKWLLNFERIEFVD